MPVLAQGPLTQCDIVRHTRPVARATLILLAYRVEGTRAPELLLATFDTSALLIDASGGGVASTATASPSSHHPDPNPDPNPDPYPGPNQATSAFALPVTERADVYAFGMTCYEVPSP
eukprot:scaffold3618_cov29-Phaeocystis_antarctica.AAC.1